MKTDKLNEAIALVRAGEKEDARQILFEFIRNEPENEIAWIWLAETLSSNQDRMKIYNACLENNPESKIIKMAISRLKSISDEEFKISFRVNPFSEEGTFDPGARERTGHTGALIGQDGSFILNNVADFDEIIDLRSPDDDILNQRLFSTINIKQESDRNVSSIDANSTKELDYEPDLSELLDDEFLPEDRFSERDQAETYASPGPLSPDEHELQKDFSANPDTTFSSKESSRELHEEITTPLNSDNYEAVSEKAAEPIFTSSLADEFLRDDPTGDLAEPDEAYSYDFADESDVELDFEPDLTSFLASEKIDVAPVAFAAGSLAAGEKFDKKFDLDEIPLEDELSLEELGFAERLDAAKPEEIEKPSDAVIAPVGPVVKELSNEFEFDDSEPGISQNKKRQREIFLIGGAALILFLVLIIITVSAFPGITPGIPKRTPTITQTDVALIPTATTEKIVLPPVVDTTPELETENPTETPTPQVTETAVIILMPSNTTAPSTTPTPTGTATRVATRTSTRTQTPTNTQRPANTRTPTPTPTNTSVPPTNTPIPTDVPPTNTPIKTLIPTITPAPTETPVPPTDTPEPANISSG